MKSSILASTALMAYPWLNTWASSPAGIPTGEKVRIGFIGVGSRGRALLLNLKGIADELNIEIAAVCDDYEPNYKRALELMEGKARAFHDYREMLDMIDLDAVIIATPLHEHAHMTVNALEAGKHVFCEKAMARHLPDVKKMADAHYNTGRILQIGHQRMYDHRYLKAIDMIRNGDIGQLTQIRAYWHRNNDWRRPVPKEHPELERKINWRLYDEYSCGLMTELASHQIQVANWLKDDFPVSVRGAGSINYWKDGREVYDNVATIYSYADGTQFIFDSMTSNRHYGLEEQIMGDKGTLELESNLFFSETPPKPPGILQLINDIEHSIFDNIPIGGPSWVPETAMKYKGEKILPELDFNENQLQLEAFVNSVREGKPLPGVFEQGYWASVWTLLGHQAMRENSIFELPEEYNIQKTIS